jgi:addiction module RelB/DinJ family antitoxin
MSHTSVLQIRVETELKKEADDLFSDIGLDTPSAVRLFLKQSVSQNCIPFQLKRNNNRQFSKPEKLVVNQEDWETINSEIDNPHPLNNNLVGLISESVCAQERKAGFREDESRA